MSKYQQGTADGPIKSDHHDYQKNLKASEKFIAKMAKKIPFGMQVAIKDSEQLQRSLITFSYSPPIESPEKRFAQSICLHDSFSNVREQVSKAWATYAQNLAKPPLNALEQLIIENMTGDSPK